MKKSIIATCVTCLLSISACGPFTLRASEELPATVVSPESRAIAFLASEVPRWSRENKCFSCHNNGDAARALFAAKALPPDVETKLSDGGTKPLEDTTDWLTHPQRWAHNGGEGEFNDKQLAAIQFAFALAEGIRLGHLDDRRPLIAAARDVSGFQKPDGAWRTVAAGTLGSPITYGNTLATVVARQTLIEAGGDRFAKPIAQAERWLRQQRPQSVLDSAALLLAFPDGGDPPAVMRRRKCLELIRAGQHTDGGWGPYVNSGPEPFDTAIVVLALCGLAGDSGIAEQIAEGRSYLVSTQQPDGSWLETTRPTGDESYAHRISTTGWAALALVATRAGAKKSE